MTIQLVVCKKIGIFSSEDDNKHIQCNTTPRHCASSQTNCIPFNLPPDGVLELVLISVLPSVEAVP